MAQPPPQLRLLLCLLLILTLNGCSRQELFDKAMAWERSSAGLTVDQIEVGELSISYLHNQEANDGPTLVMLHGFGGNKDNWVRMAGELTDQFNVVALDLPGHGDSSKPLTLGYRLEDQVGYVHDTLAALGESKVHLLGNSMGGAITALYAATYPDQVHSASLFSPAGVFKYDSELVTRIEEGQNPLIVSQPGDMERLVAFVMSDQPFVPWPIYDVMEQQAIANRPVYEKIFLAIRDSGYDNAFRDRLADIQAPVMLVWGRQDRVIDYRNAEVFQQRINTTVTHLLDDIGHVPMIETPDHSAELVRAFINAPPAAGATVIR
ncbi:alpha/beta fold hydrolase [Marinobacter xestospongiae]|uniref:alpha/beta fold hydrolase n=1 Tax=Marinobacter xestospongiae TaxID=994319 RepID=UPI0020067E17|nr:alpha/beta fold hydrolase [Marinobacter xestospongiae]MCK7566630.1 alpha/beta fold hydrolase [Marinobacter xestospongiae]